MLHLKWHGPVFSPSGYGQANRDYLQALHKVGVRLSVQPHGPDGRPPETFGPQGQLVAGLRGSGGDVVVCHMVPNRVKDFVEPGKFNVGVNTWETDHLPPHWVANMNKFFDLVVVPSDFNKHLYSKNGVRTPVEVVPHCFDINRTPGEFPLPPEVETKFKFLSVFQWTERKNPRGLLTAYLTEFDPRDEVVLILKTYRSNTSEKEIQVIKAEIDRVKKDLNLREYPPIYLVTDIIPTEHLDSLYAQADAFVLPFRAEGFGMPVAESLLNKTPVICTGYSSHSSLLNNCFTTKYQLTPVSGMNWIPHYTGKAAWAEPDLMDLKSKMRRFYESETLRNIYAKKGHNYVSKNLNYDKIGERFQAVIEKHLE